MIQSVIPTMAQYCPRFNTSLQRLVLNRTEVSELAPLRGLAKLKILTLENTKVHNVAALTTLTALIPSDVSHDTVAQLRLVMEARRSGMAIRLFHAVQQASTMAS